MTGKGAVGCDLAMRSCNSVCLLVGGDLRFVLQRQPDVVQPVQQAVAAEGVDLERKRQTEGVGDRALFQVHA